MQDDKYGFEEDFQKSIVASALKDPAFLLQYEDVLAPKYFDYEYLSSILRTARELTERLGEVPNKATVVEEIKEYCVRFNITSADREFILCQLEGLYGTDISDLSYVQSRVVDFGQRQALRSAVLNIVQLFKKSTASDTYEKARDILERALSVGLDTRSLGLSLYPNLLNLPEMASKSVAGLAKKVRTGFGTIDKATRGGPSRGELWVVVGLPGRGKSALLVQLGARALRDGYAVMHFTIGDLEEIDVAIRYAACLTGCTTHEVITNDPSYVRKASKLARYNPHLFIKYFPPDSVSVNHVRSHLSKLRSVEDVRPAVTIVDYPEEMKMLVKNDLYLSGGANYSALKKISSDFMTLTWSASQPTRWKPEHEKDVIKGINMGESWKKFQKVDGMMSWNMDYEDELYGRGRLWVDKTRRAKSFYQVHCDVDLDKMRIREVEKEEEAA